MSSQVSRWLLSSLCIALAGCSDSGGNVCTPGTLGCACDTDGLCVEGATCLSEVCVGEVTESSPLKDAPTGGGGEPSAGLEGTGQDGSSGSSATGGATASESMPDAAVAASCSVAGAERCAPGGGPSRELCMDGSYVEAEPCPEGQVCVDAASGTRCEVSSGPCQGRGGDVVCDGSDMYQCDDVGAATLLEQCDSPQHCSGGVAAGQCLSCLDGEYGCDGSDLQRCQGDEFSTEETCASASLCNPTARACTDQVCVPNETSCDGDVSRTCNGEGTALDLGQACSSGCNRQTGECNVCVPSVARCDGQTRFVCSASGEVETSSECEDHCVNGECVQCRNSVDCDPDNDCQSGTCDDGTCEIEDRAPGSDCTRGLFGLEAGYCDGAGACDECSGSGKAQCTGEFELCIDGACVDHCGNSRFDPAAGEECDLSASGYDEYTCTDDCRERTLYTPCDGDSDCVEYGCGVLIGGGTGDTHCGGAGLSCGTDGVRHSACPAPVGGTFGYCLFTRCGVECTTSQQCPVGWSCLPYSDTSVCFAPVQ